jgi:hypothetical protein
VVSAAGAQRQYFLHVVPEEEPDFSGKRHIDVEIGEKHPDTGASVIVIVAVHSFSSRERDSLRSVPAGFCRCFLSV